MSQAPPPFDPLSNRENDGRSALFLKKSAHKWGKHLNIKRTLLAAFFLASSFTSSFYSHNLSHLFLLFTYFLVAPSALLRTIEEVKNGEINIDLLMTLAGFLSFFINSQMEGALLLVLFACSETMEETISQNAKGALIHLDHISPVMTTVVEAGGELQAKSVREIEVGTRLFIKAQETIPLDGFVIDGSSFVDLTYLTGESLPIRKKRGDAVHAGSRNLEGTLTIRVTKTRRDSTLSKIIELVNRAHEMKPKVQRFLDRFGKYYAISIICFSSLLALTLPLFSDLPFLGVEGAAYRAITFLIAASPCALIIATPTAYLSAISACARKGILLKGGVALEALAKCKTIAFDKTGTLTTGKLVCHRVEKISGSRCSTEEAICLAASLEKHVNHPIAEAICKLAEKQEIAMVPIEEFRSTTGSGLCGMATMRGKKREVYLGNWDFIGPKIKGCAPPGEDMEEMTTLLLVDRTLFSFRFRDTLRPQIARTLKQLKEGALKLTMLTGDHEKSAKRIAKELGIDLVYANLRPENKFEAISSLAKEGDLAMVGDGINDAPALARATVGIALGKIGNTAAIDASDIVFLQDHLDGIYWLYRKARNTAHIIRENFTLAIGIISLATLSALLGWLPLWLAVVLHEGGTLLVSLNSLRLLRK